MIMPFLQSLRDNGLLNQQVLNLVMVGLTQLELISSLAHEGVPIGSP